MREKVLSLAKGKFVYENPELIVKPEVLTGEIEAGKAKKFMLEVTNAKGTRVKGFGSAGASQVYFLPVFNGEKNELEVDFNASDCPEGAVLSGVISLVTDCGEKEVPYEIKVVPPTLRTSSGGALDNYYQLQQLMKSHPEEAVELFRSKEFADVFLYRDEIGKLIYDHLVEKNTKKQGVEEFMTAMGKKDVVCFQALHLPSGSAEFIPYELNGSDIYDNIRIDLSAQGNIEIRAKSTVDFIELETHVFHTEEFEKNSDILEFRICMDKVPEGIRRGAIILESVYQRQVIEIEAHNVILAADRKANRAIRQMYAMLLRDILAYEEGRMPEDEYCRMLSNNKSAIMRMFPHSAATVAGYLAVMLKNEKEILEFFQKTEGMQPPALDGTQEEVENYLLMEYVKYLYTKREDDRTRLAMLVQGYEEHGYHSALIFAVGIHVDERYDSVPLLVADTKEKIRKGNYSPVLFSLLMQCYEQDHSVLKELEREDVRALHYGARNGLISRELSVNISFLAQTIKGFDELLFSVLTKLYERYGQIDTLVVICEMLIRNEKRSKKYFPWFQRGVQNHLRITELFEYYMYAMSGDEIEDLPESVVVYFQFENHLSDRYKAKLYTYIIRNKETKANYYNMFRDNIHKYGLMQLMKHRINYDLGMIYRDILLEREWNVQWATDLPYVMFTHILQCDNDQMDAVVVVHPEIKDEIIYQLHKGKTHIQLYTPDAIILFVDKKGHYHCGTIDYTIDSLFPMDDCSDVCYDSGSEHYGMLCHMAVKALRQPKLTEKHAEVIEKVLDGEYLRTHAEGTANVKLYDYYRSCGDTEKMLNILDRIVPQDIKPDRVGEFAAACIYRGLYDKALNLLKRSNTVQCEEKALLMLVQQQMNEKNNDFSPNVLKWCEHLYRKGVYEPCVLQYLLSYYMGSTKTLTSVYLKSKGIPEFTLDDVCRERLLGQVLFAGADPMPYEKLFNDYYDNGKNRVLVKAFMSYYAYEYLMERIELSENLLMKIQKEAFYVKDDVMVLAMLYYFSKCSEWTEKQREFIEISLEKFAADARLFRFMKDFVGKISLPYEIENSNIVEYRSGTTQNVYLHLEDGEGNTKVVLMRNIFDGVYSYPLLLFDGEEMKIHIREEETGRETEPVVLKGEAATDRKGSFFQMMNRVIRAEEMGQTEEYKQLQKEYETCRMAAEHLFQIL